MNWLAKRRARRSADAQLAVLTHLLRYGAGDGYEIGKACKLRGRLYPTLRALERAGMIGRAKQTWCTRCGQTWWT